MNIPITIFHRNYFLAIAIGLLFGIILALVSLLIIPREKLLTHIPVPSFTGALKEKIPEDEERAIQLFARLRDLTPVIQDGFELSFDYKKNVFVVLLDKPYDLRKIDFLHWLGDNGYQSLPNDVFVFYAQ